jgi:hypothetical protein
MVAGAGFIALVVAGAYVALIGGTLFLLYRTGVVRREAAAEA